MKRILILITILTGFITVIEAQNKIGIIGLDTSHAIAFTKFLNGDDKKEEFKDFTIVAAYPYGSKTIESSYKRIPEYIKQVEALGVEIVPSIAELLNRVDFVMLETNDGNLHLEQAYEVFKAGKPVFIDKPIGANLEQAIAIFELAKRYNIPMFSASSLRYIEVAQQLREGKYGEVTGADCYSPATYEPSHSDLAWYGIHGVETLFTIMGTGCKAVNRMSSEGTDVTVGLWEDGRIASVRGIRTGKSDYGGQAFTTEGIFNVGPYNGYEPLLVNILEFFKTGVTPVSAKETLEIFTFIEAADESKRKEGKIISMEETYNKGAKEARRLIKRLK
ncbi:MAG: Gfo/Idh/MocA family oxidoreductase [Fermentimonas sp.]|nr:Gfo/Idh/MocA family oxidoreductase [Fermentimonas sp.]